MAEVVTLLKHTKINCTTRNFRIFKDGKNIIIKTNDDNHIIQFKADAKDFLDLKNKDEECFNELMNAIENNVLFRNLLFGKKGDRILAEIKLMR